MKSKVFPCVFLVALGIAPLFNAEESDKATDEAIRQASEAAKKMGMTIPDVKKLMEEDAQEEAKEEAKEKEKVQAVVNAPGAVAFPAWTPESS